MIRDRAVWQRWESEYRSREAPIFAHNLQWVEALYAHARALGAFSLGEPTEGLDTKVLMARILNRRWLKEFEAGLGEPFVKRFEGLIGQPKRTRAKRAKRKR